MKVAVSIPDPLFEEADRVAQQLRIPRSQLYSRALQAFVRSHSGDEITAQWNAILDRIGTLEEPGWENPGMEVARREKW